MCSALGLNRIKKNLQRGLVVKENNVSLRPLKRVTFFEKCVRKKGERLFCKPCCMSVKPLTFVAHFELTKFMKKP